MNDSVGRLHFTILILFIVLLIVALKWLHKDTAPAPVTSTRDDVTVNNECPQDDTIQDTVTVRI